MTDTTPRLALPFIHPGQAQKELYHNEALALIDIGLQASVLAAGVNTPPESPADGDCWIVGDSPTGAWAGRAQAIAGWTGNGWRFVAPSEGMQAWLQSDAVLARFHLGDWESGVVRAAQVKTGGVQVVGLRQAAIPLPDGGTTVDVEARAALTAIITALRSHGLIES